MKAIMSPSHDDHAQIWINGEKWFNDSTWTGHPVEVDFDIEVDLKAGGNVLLYRCGESGGHDYANLHFDDKTMDKVKIYPDKAKSKEAFFDEITLAFGQSVVKPQNDNPITQKQRLEVKINMSTSELIHDFTSNLIFNPQILKATSVDYGSFLTHDGADPTTCSTPIIDNAKGQVTGIACRRNTEDGVTGRGVLATINFEAIGVGESALIIEKASFSNPKGEAIEFTTRDGKVTVYGPHAKVTGKVTDSQDQPVYGVEMVAFLDDQPVGINGETDWSGNYLIDNITQAGRVTVMAAKPGVMPINPVEVDVRIGQATENVDFTVFEPTPLHSVVDAEGFIRNWLLLGPIPWENDTTRLMSDQSNPKTQAEDDCLEVAHHAIIQLLNQQHTIVTVNL